MMVSVSGLSFRGFRLPVDRGGVLFALLYCTLLVFALPQGM